MNSQKSQYRQSDHFAELDKLRKNVRGLVETLEDRAQSPTRPVGPTDQVKPLAPTDRTVRMHVTVKTQSVGEHATIHGTGCGPMWTSLCPLGEVISQGDSGEQTDVSVTFVAGAAAGLRTI